MTVLNYAQTTTLRDLLNYATEGHPEGPWAAMPRCVRVEGHGTITVGLVGDDRPTVVVWVTEEGRVCDRDSTDEGLISARLEWLPDELWDWAASPACLIPGSPCLSLQVTSAGSEELPRSPELLDARATIRAGALL